MKLNKWIAGIGIALVAAFGTMGVVGQAHAVSPTHAVSFTVEPGQPGQGDHGIWP